MLTDIVLNDLKSSIKICRSRLQDTYFINQDQKSWGLKYVSW